ncbi:hypothetical protein BHM03_00056137 [Ensete ventricosum]|nr:hypothetical protein BHM03_00056137 [Ensete ventricosum]
MRDPWNDIISLLPLQELMSFFNLCPRKASCLYFMFHFLCRLIHAAWALHQAPPKLFHSSIYIEFMVALVSTILRVNLLSSSVCTSLQVCFRLVLHWVAYPLDLAIRPPTQYLVRDHTMIPCRSLGQLSFVKSLSRGTPPQHVRSIAHDSPSGESRLFPLGYLSRQCNVSLRILPLRISETTIPFDYFDLLNKLCIVSLS